MDDSVQLEVTPRQKAAGHICAGVALALCGLFLLLCGVGAIGLSVSDVLSTSVLFAVSVGFLASGIIQKNPVSVWIAVAFFLPALVEALVHFALLDYGVLYPVYIATPAAASLITGLSFRGFKPHIPCIVFFGGLSLLFALQSSAVTGWAVAAPAVLLFVAGCVLFVAIRSFRNKEEE